MSALEVLIGVGAIVITLLAVVLVHEFGHFIVAKLSGIRVDEFAVGFGPKLLWRKRGETTYSLRAIPAGGFVRMPGMLGLEGEADAGERNFYRASKTRRFATVAAGVVFNLVFAGICFTVVNAAPTPSQTIAGMSLAENGIGNGVSILSFNGTRIAQGDPAAQAGALRDALAKDEGAPATITYRSSDGSVRSANLKPSLVLFLPAAVGDLQPGEYVADGIDGKPVGTGDPATILGAGKQVMVNVHAPGDPKQVFSAVPVSGVAAGYGTSATRVQAAWLLGLVAGHDGEAFPAAVTDGFRAVPNFIAFEFTGIYQLITGAIPGGIAGPNGIQGPVGIAQHTVQAAQGGVFGEQGLIWWIGFVSMSLGLINVLPVPFLDGGKLFFIAVEAIRRRRVSPRIEAVASAIGLSLLVLLVIYVTIGNVSRL
ncbi:MAG: RIP metalloprotease [Candidatus Dormibacteria bacterium]